MRGDDDAEYILMTKDLLTMTLLDLFPTLRHTRDSGSKRNYATLFTTPLVSAQLKKLVRSEHHCRVTPATLSNKAVAVLDDLTGVPSVFHHCLRWLC
jgi:hypothetical protein